VDIREEFLALIDALHKAGTEYAVCGGIALLFHGYPRLTTDIDLLVQDSDIDKVKGAAAGVGFTVATPQPIVLQTGTPSETHVYRVSKFEGDEHLVLDLVLVGPSLEPVWASREQRPLEGRSVTVVSVDGLIRMKRATGRKQDAADIEYLESGDDES
jgi:hypothetical protein